MTHPRIATLAQDSPVGPSRRAARHAPLKVSLGRVAIRRVLPAPLDIRVLGPVEVVVGPGDAVALGKPRQRTLLGLLALRPRRLVSQAALVDALWGDDPPPSAVKTLHSHVSRLRRSLGSAGLDELVDTRPPGYLLTAAPESVDAARFDALVDVGTGLPAGEAAERLRAALALWRGDLLGGSPVGDWARAEAARLEEARLRAAEDLFEAELATSRHARVAGKLGAFVAQNPLRERPSELLIFAFYRGGRQGDALGAYRRAHAVSAGAGGRAGTGVTAPGDRSWPVASCGRATGSPPTPSGRRSPDPGSRPRSST